MIKDKLKYNSLLKIGSGLYRLTGKTGDRYVVVCANQWHIENKYVKYIKIIEKYLRYDENFRKSLEEKDGKIVISPASNEEQKELFVSREKNTELYDLIVGQLSKSIYNLSSLKEVMTKLINGKEIFESLPVSEQTVLLKNLVDYVGGAREVNLKALGYSQHCGAQRIDKKITDMSVSLICQSMTGIFQKEIRL